MFCPMSDVSYAPLARAQPQWAVLAAAAALLLGGVIWIWDAVSLKQASLLVIGGGLGAVLYATTFGFAGGWRRWFTNGDATAFAAQLLLVALTTGLFAPLFAAGELFDQRMQGFVAPAGLMVAIGAFLFGIGTQLGGACASGTLFTLGGGSTRMVVTVLFFCIGGWIATLHWDFWMALPQPPPVSLGRELGWGNAALLQIFILVALALILKPKGRPWPRILILGVIGLAALNALVLVVSGGPWSVTWAFTVWGAKLAAAFGWDPVGTTAFWGKGGAVTGSLLNERISVLNVGIALGALAVASSFGRWRPTLNIGAGPLAAAVIGGLLLGYGSRIAFGCNIGAFVSGIASTSLHGWLWIASALAGAWAGIKMRPLFRLD